MDKQFIKLKIKDFDNTIFDDEVKAISSLNKFGPFDILPYHSNFITLINKKIVISLKNGEKKEIQINDGLLKNYENNIEIYLGINSIMNL